MHGSVHGLMHGIGAWHGGMVHGGVVPCAISLVIMPARSLLVETIFLALNTSLSVFFHHKRKKRKESAQNKWKNLF